MIQLIADVESTNEQRRESTSSPWPNSFKSSKKLKGKGSEMTNLKVHKEESLDGVVYFDLEGMLDAHNFEVLEAMFEEYFDNSSYRFVIDIRRLVYVSSAGAGVFIGAVGTCQENDGNVVLLQPSQEVKEIFELLGIFQIFPVVQTREEALDLFTKKVV